MADADRAGAALSGGRFRTLVALFVMSGAAGLIDQVCFSKYLSYVVGATAYAVSAVLAAFMTGLTVGAAIGGRLSHRVKRPLVAYGLAEIVVGVAVAGTPLAFAALTPIYVAIARATHGSVAVLGVARWFIAMLFVVVPTIAMGATLPLVSASLAEGASDGARRTREGRLGILYAANTFGGAAGALAGAYLVLPALGLSRTLFASALVSTAAGAIAIVLGRGMTESGTMATDVAPSSETSRPAPAMDDALGERWIEGLSFASGALAFTTEVVATHLLAVIVGNSAYAFGLILAAFLCCLFFGAALATPLSRLAGNAALATSLALTAFAFAGTLPFWDDLPLLFVGLDKHLLTFESREAMRGVVAFSILVLPATCMGITFPLVLQWAARKPDVGRIVGRLAAINTVGAVFGALATGYLVLPRLGSERTLRFVLLVFVALAAGTALRTAKSEKRKLPVALAVVAAAFSLFLPRWDLVRLTAGANVYFDGSQPVDQLLSVREDVHGGITTVTVKGERHTLYTNGKFQGNDGWELKAQHYFAHYPCLFVPKFDDVLIIGLGTGTTAGTLAGYPWKSIDLVEISPAIADAARRFFGHTNRHVFDDPRFHLLVDDARNHLLVHEKRYDLVSMELSSVWFAGASSLYSSEYYRLVRDHLSEGGVLQQWVQLHHVYQPVFATLVNTLRREFAHVAFFYGGDQGMLIASMRPLVWSEKRATELTARPSIQETLDGGRTLPELAGDAILVDESLDAFVKGTADESGRSLESMVSTDDNLYLEYETPRGNVLPWIAREALVARIKTYRDEAAILALRGGATEI